MQWIKYKIKQCTIGEEDVLVNKKVGYSEANLAIAQAEAYNGQYEIIEDGKTYDKEPLAIEFGGTGAKTADEACKNIGGINTYTQSSGTLTGTGLNGKFKATTTGTYTKFTIGSVSYAVKAGSETEIELTSGVWYSFILDTGAKTINFKAGGAGLNFKIVGGTTQPTSPKENTIWVNTSTAIKEYQFSATQPTTRADGTALQNGDVWVATSEHSALTLNVVKKNAIFIQLATCCQYINGSWETKDMLIYQNGSWKSSVIYLYDKGDQHTDLTGGWAHLNHTDYPNGSATFGTDRITLSTNGGAPSALTKNKIDVTNIKTISVQVLSSSQTTYGMLYLGKSYISNTGPANMVAGAEITAIGTTTLDVSGVTGEYYVGVMALGVGNGARSVTFDKVYMS